MYRRFVLLLASLLTMTHLAGANDLSGFRLYLADKLQAAGHQVLIGNEAGNPFGEDAIILAYRAPSSLVSAFIKPVPAGDYTPDWVTPRFEGQARAFRKGDHALIVVGADANDAGMNLLKAEFQAVRLDSPSQAAAKKSKARKDSPELAMNRYWFKRWVESAPDKMALGSFVLSFMSENADELERVGQDLQGQGLSVVWSITPIGEKKTYWANAMLKNVWGPEPLTLKLADLSDYWATRNAVVFHGWTPVDVGKNLEPIFPQGDVEYFETPPWKK